MINWDNLRTGYNEKNGTDYKTVEQMAIELYSMTLSLTKSAKILGVSRPQFAKKIGNFSLVKSGNRRGIKYQMFLAITAEDMAEMTRHEIMEACNICSSYVDKLIAKYNRKFKRMGNFRKNGSKTML